MALGRHRYMQPGAGLLRDILRNERTIRRLKTALVRVCGERDAAVSNYTNASGRAEKWRAHAHRYAEETAAAESARDLAVTMPRAESSSPGAIVEPETVCGCSFGYVKGACPMCDNEGEKPDEPQPVDTCDHCGKPHPGGGMCCACAGCPDCKPQPAAGEVPECVAECSGDRICVEHIRSLMHDLDSCDVCSDVDDLLEYLATTPTQALVLAGDAAAWEELRATVEAHCKNVLDEQTERTDITLMRVCKALTALPKGGDDE